MHFSQSQDRDLFPYEKEAIDLFSNQMDKINAKFLHCPINNQLLKTFKDQIIPVLNFVYELTGVEIELEDK